MSSKVESPLKKVQTNNQQFKKNADKLLGEIKKFRPKDGAAKLEGYKTRLAELTAQSTALITAVQALKAEEEPKADAKFEQKKAAEEKLIKDYITKLEVQTLEFPTVNAPGATQKTPAATAPPASKQEPPKSPAKPAPAAKSKKEDEDEEDEVEEETEATDDAEIFVALQDWEGEEEDDLPIKKGEMLTFVEEEEEDESIWLMRNSKGEEGFVLADLLKELPSSGSKKHVRIDDKAAGSKKASKNEDEEEEEEDEEDETELSQVDSTMMSETVDSRKGESEEEEEEEFSRSRKSGKFLWKKVAKLATQTSTTDVLHALGALSFGYRGSFLGPLAEVGHKYDLLSYLPASLSDSRLFFRDLFLDPQTFALRPRNARLQRSVTLVQVRNLPLLIDGVEVFSRHVRICLFDGKNVLSNIHTVRATCTDKEQKVWSFVNRPADPVVKILESGEFFIRSCQSSTDIGILFECNARCIRTGTAESIEISCGWVFIPLFDNNGQLVPNKQYELTLNGGTPFEKNVTLDPFKKIEDVNPLKSMMIQQQVPTLVVKLALPAKEQKDYIDLLPEVIIGNMRLISLFALYREILADALLKDRDDLNSAEPYFSPFLANFPKLVEQPDIMDSLRSVWNDFLTTSKQKTNKDVQKEMIQQLFMQVAYPLCFCDQMPQWKIGDKKSEDERAAIIKKMLDNYKTQKSASAILLSSEYSFAPMSMEELVYRVDAE